MINQIIVKIDQQGDPTIPNFVDASIPNNYF